jgi:hypothetical protein
MKGRTLGCPPKWEFIELHLWKNGTRSGLVESPPMRSWAAKPNCSKQFACNLLSEMLPHGSKRAKYLFYKSLTWW